MRARDFAQAAACPTITDNSYAVYVSRRATDSNASSFGAPVPGASLGVESHDRLSKGLQHYWRLMDLGLELPKTSRIET